jgi:hypothetical protein
VLIDTAAGLRLEPRSLEAAETITVPDRTILVLSRRSAPSWVP